MGKGDPCGVCGETRMRLVDGFFYCVECGTQDTNVQETVVEHQALGDGTFAVARRSRYSVKIKEGVEMSPEWYKWHKYNFLLAGLTELLIELGAAPSVRMKVLWIWSRYIKMFQKKEAMGPAQVLKQLEVGSSSSEAEEQEEEAEEVGPRTAHAKSLRVDRVTNYMVVAILALALNFDRSPILVSQFMRFLRWRLLPVADKFRFVPAEVLDKLRGRRMRQLTATSYDTTALMVFFHLPVMMCRVSRLLALGAPLTPDVDAALHAQLRELRVQRALAVRCCRVSRLLALGAPLTPDVDAALHAQLRELRVQRALAVRCCRVSRLLALGAPLTPDVDAALHAQLRELRVQRALAVRCCRVSRLLALGAPLTPDVDAALHAQLRELRVQRALAVRCCRVSRLLALGAPLTPDVDAALHAQLRELRVQRALAVRCCRVSRLLALGAPLTPDVDAALHAQLRELRVQRALAVRCCRVSRLLALGAPLTPDVDAALHAQLRELRVQRALAVRCCRVSRLLALGAPLTPDVDAALHAQLRELRVQRALAVRCCRVSRLLALGAPLTPDVDAALHAQLRELRVQRALAVRCCRVSRLLALGAPLTPDVDAALHAQLRELRVQRALAVRCCRVSRLLALGAPLTPDVDAALHAQLRELRVQRALAVRCCRVSRLLALGAPLTPDVDAALHAQLRELRVQRALAVRCCRVSRLLALGAPLTPDVDAALHAQLRELRVQRALAVRCCRVSRLLALGAPLTPDVDAALHAQLRELRVQRALAVRCCRVSRLLALGAPLTPDVDAALHAQLRELRVQRALAVRCCRVSRLLALGAPLTPDVDAALHAQLRELRVQRALAVRCCRVSRLLALGAPLTPDVDAALHAQLRELRVQRALAVRCCRVSRLLALGAPLTPDVDAALHAQLRELRVQRALAVRCCRVSRLLALGAPLTPDVDAALHAQLRELRVQRALAVRCCRVSRLLALGAPLTPDVDAALHAQLRELRVQRALAVRCCRVSRLLALGAPLTPDVDAALHAQLRELRLPRALAALVRALMDVAPVPFKGKPLSTSRETLGGDYFPDYETTLMAYIVVALKMCFGLDDDYERRLSDAVDMINEEAAHPLAYSSCPEPTGRLFSFRSWAAHLRLRALVASQHAAPLAWARGAHPARGGGDAAMEHLGEFTSERQRDPDKTIRKGAKARLTDQVTMEILDRIPKRYEVGVLSLEELKPAMASREPQTAIVRAIGHLLPAERRKLLDEDFTQYSLEYAYKHLALPTSRPHKKLFRGVNANNACGRRLGDAVYSSNADTTTVYVKNCSNRNWARARRPTAAHVLPVHDSDAGYDSRETKEEEERENLQTFVEEDEGRNIFDDDFSDIPIKDEKPDSKDDVNVDETKDNINWGDDTGNFESAGFEDDADERGILDSDDEVEPQFNPDTFNRKEVIKEMMAAAYRNRYLQVPARFLALGEKPKSKRKKTDLQSRKYIYGIGTPYWANKLKKQEDTAKVEDLIATYWGNLHSDVLHQVEEQVRAFTNANEIADVIGPASELADPSFHTDGNAMEAQDVDESRDVELIENEAKNDKSNDEDSCEEHAYDPVLKNDANFDEKTHDVEQLYVKLKELPPEAEPAASPAPADDLTAIIDQTIRQMKPRKIKKKERIIIKTDIDHLVDDPKRITRFNYWFTILIKRTKDIKHFLKSDRRVEKEFEENSSRSFWFVLKECSAVLDVMPLRLYRLVTDIEQQMLKLLPKKQRKGNELKKRGRHRLCEHRLDEYPKKKLGRPRKHMDKYVSRESGLHCRPERLRKDFKNASASQSQHRPRKLGRQRKTLDGNLSETSDSQEWRPETLSEDSSTSEDQDQPRKRGRPRKPLGENTSENRNSQRERPSKYLKESSTSKNQDKSKKRERPRKTLDESSEDSVYAQNPGQSRKRGRPRKTLGKIISDDSDSDSQGLKPRKSSNDLEDTTQNQDQPRNRGIPHKTFDGNNSDTSDSHDSNPERPRKDSEDSNSSQNRLRKRGKPYKPLKDTNDPQYCNSEKLCENSEDSSTLQNRRRKRERPLKPLDETPSEDSDSRQSRPESFTKQLEDSTSQDQDPPRKQGRPLKFLKESVSEDSDSPECQQERFGTLSRDIEDESASQNQYPPRKQVKPLKFSDESLSEDSYSQHWRSERLDKASEDVSTSQNQDQPRKRGTTLKSFDDSLSEDSDSEKWKPGRSIKNQEHPTKRVRTRLSKSLDGNVSENSDSDKSTPKRSRTYSDSSLQEGESASQKHQRKRGRTTPQNKEHPKKRVGTRLRKSLDGNVSEGSDSDKSTPGRSRTYSDSSLQEGKSALQKHQSKRERNTPQNQERPKKRVRTRPLNSLDGNVSEDSDSNKSTPERSGTYSDLGSQEGDSASQKQEYQRKRGRNTPQKQEHPKKRRRPLKSVDEDHSEASASQRSTPEKSRIYLYSSHQGDKSPSRNQELPRKRRRPRKSIDGSVLELSASKKGSPKRCSKFDLSLQDQSTSISHQHVAGNPPKGNISKRSTPERSSTYLSSRLFIDSSTLQGQEHPRKSWGESTLQNRTHEIASADMISSLREDNNSSNNQEQPRKRNRPSKPMDGSLLEASASQKTTPEKQSRASKYLKVVSRSQKEKYPGTKSGEVTLSEVMNILQERRPERLKPNKYVKDASDSQNQANPSQPGKPCKSMDFPKISILHRKPERPSTYLNWTPLGNASTPQNQGHSNKPERFSKYVERSLPDISAIQDSTAEASFLRNKTEEYSETKVISFDQF
ncbi:uncharacterized protein LOC134750764 [Cydia strobilella]|uniref:uncharacterized protein LOC134750764 n=1 Tax=Cydia strobilella TaxID=1100964 RepID=UPI0030050C6C